MQEWEGIHNRPLYDFWIWFIYSHFLSLFPYKTDRIRSTFLKKLLRIGDGTIVAHKVRIIYPKGISIGCNCAISTGVILDGRGNLEIGDKVLIGFESVILTCTHRSDDCTIPIIDQGVYAKPVIIKDGAWIGARAVILPGISIGEQSIIGANAVVTHDVPPYSVVGGVPARHIKTRICREVNNE